MQGCTQDTRPLEICLRSSLDLHTFTHIHAVPSRQMYHMHMTCSQASYM